MAESGNKGSRLFCERLAASSTIEATFVDTSSSASESIVYARENLSPVESGPLDRTADDAWLSADAGRGGANWLGRCGRKKAGWGRTPPACVPPAMPVNVEDEGEVGPSRSPRRERVVMPEEVRTCECVPSAGLERVRGLLPLRARAGLGLILGVGPMGSRCGEGEGDREGVVGESNECGCAIVVGVSVDEKLRRRASRFSERPFPGAKQRMLARLSTSLFEANTQS